MTNQYDTPLPDSEQEGRASAIAILVQTCFIDAEEALLLQNFFERDTLMRAVAIIENDE